MPQSSFGAYLISLPTLSLPVSLAFIALFFRDVLTMGVGGYASNLVREKVETARFHHFSFRFSSHTLDIKSQYYTHPAKFKTESNSHVINKRGSYPRGLGLVTFKRRVYPPQEFTFVHTVLQGATP